MSQEITEPVFKCLFCFIKYKRYKTHIHANLASQKNLKYTDRKCFTGRKDHYELGWTKNYFHRRGTWAGEGFRATKSTES